MPDKHWTVTIQVHEVTPPEPIREASGYAVKVTNSQTRQQDVVMRPREVVERFSTTVRADTEEAAYRKAIALLEINRPEEGGDQTDLKSWGSDAPIAQA